MPKCVICNKEVHPDHAAKAKYHIHLKCYKRAAPISARLAAAKAEMARPEWMPCGNCHGEGCSKCKGSGGRYYPEQRTGDESI